MSDNFVAEAERLAYLQARAQLTAWEWAEVERPDVYADLKFGPVSDGRDPIDVARQLWRDLRTRKAARGDL